MLEATPRTVGVWGMFDTDVFGDALLPHILRRELTARLPDVAVRLAAPFGYRRPRPRDGGDPAEPLGSWSQREVAAAATGLDCLVVAGADLLPDHGDLAAKYGVGPKVVERIQPGRFFVEGPGGDSRCPVVWQAVTLGTDPTPEQALRLRKAAERLAIISVADEAARQRFAAAGVERPISVVPDAALLAPRLFTQELLAKRLDFLRLMGWYPIEGAPLLIEADGALLARSDEFAASIGSLQAMGPFVPVVVAEMGAAGDTAFARAIMARLPGGTVFRLPRCAGLEDLAATVAHCRAFAAMSPRASLVSLAYGRPHLVLDGPDSLAAALAAPYPESPGALVGQVDAFLDRIADIAAYGPSRNPHRHKEAASMPDTNQLANVEEELHNLEVAHEARSRRLSTERMVFTNHLHKAEAEIARLKEEVAQLREELRQAGTRVADAQAAARAEAAARASTQEELAALRATRTFRYTAELRTVYGRLRRITDPQDAKTSQ